MTSGVWTFAFVDMAGFTALTEAHGDETAAGHAARFYQLARESLVGSAQLVKHIGDAVLIVSDEPDEALATVRNLTVAVEEEANFPLVRGGLHTGSAVRSTDGPGPADYFGSGVNVAARVAATAACRQVLLTDAVASDLDATKWSLRPLGRTQFRNVPEPLNLFELIIEEAAEGAVDPVCRMRIPPTAVIGSIRHGDSMLVFCSLECLAAFTANPDRYGEGGRSGLAQD
jgi:class 3 adenylate cyclase